MKDKPLFDYNVDMEEAIKAFNKRRALIAKSIETVEDFPEYDINGKKFDSRDLREMLGFLPIIGKDEEEQIECIKNNYKNMIHAFVSNDEDEIEKYMDSMYTEYDKLTDFYKNGINTIDDFVDYQFIFSADQTLQVKRREYPNLFYKHYNTDEKLKGFTTNSFLFFPNIASLSKIKDEHKDFSNKGLFPYEEDMYKDERGIADSAFDAYDNNSNVIEIRDTSKLISSIDADLEDIREKTPISTMVFTNHFTNDILQKELKTKAKDLNEYKLTYIDGKNLYELSKKEIEKTYNFENEEQKKDYINRNCRKILQSTLAKGDKVVSFATPKTVNGKIEFDITKIRPNVKPQEEAERAKHSAFRLKYFNWGPFKVLPSQDYIDNKVNSKSYDKDILKDASKVFDEMVKEGKARAVLEPEEDKTFVIGEAKKYLQKEINQDLQKDTDLNKSIDSKDEVQPFIDNEIKIENKEPEIKSE